MHSEKQYKKLIQATKAEDLRREKGMSDVSDEGEKEGAGNLGYEHSGSEVSAEENYL
jgi:hypothetical protein